MKPRIMLFLCMCLICGINCIGNNEVSHKPIIEGKNASPSEIEINSDSQVELKNDSQIKKFELLKSGKLVMITNKNSLRALLLDEKKVLKELSIGKALGYECLDFGEGSGWITDYKGELWNSTDGENWANVSNILKSVSSKYPTIDCDDIKFTSKDSGWLISSLGFLKTTNGGKTWNKVKEISKDVWFMFFIDEKNGWVVTGDENNNQWLLHTSDAGLSWKSQQLHGFVVEEILFTDLNMGWVVSRAGEVYHSGSGGREWTKLQNLNSKFIARSIVWKNSQIGWVAGYSFDEENRSLPKYGKPVLMKTTDSGITWSKVLIDCDDHFFDKIKIFSSDVMVMSSQNSLYESQDNGETWKRIVTFPPIN